MVNQIDDIGVSFTGESNTLIVYNKDTPGNVSKISSLLASNNINIATMQLYRNKKGGLAVTILETDQEVPQNIIDRVGRLDDIIKVTYLEAVIL